MGSDGGFARSKTDLEPRRTIQEVVCGGSEAPSGHLGRTAPRAGHTDRTARVFGGDSRLAILTRL